jgi:hypothetical protein
MPLPSLYISGDNARDWSVARAAGYGAVLGALAGLFRTFGLLHQPSGASVTDIAVGALGFAVLCAGAAALRNRIARRLIWPDLP